MTGYEPNSECLGCEREKECLVIETESYRGPHCAKCIQREGQKRSQPNTPTAPLIDRGANTNG